ncbi:MAG TPA: tetratricopeptide repeat protein, partial [Ramlibacter sp.]|nr:tetratricopeptide repeat protein [Ramlibacter sp.]
MTADIDTLKKKFREGRRAEAVAECDVLCAQAPADLPLKRLCATMHLMMHDFARSLELLREVRAHDPGNADVLFNIGMCQRELGDFQGAARDFKAYTAKFPGHPDGWACLAESRFKLNEFKDATADADRALQIDAASVPAWKVRGDCQKAIGQFENALASYSQAIRLAPGVAELLVRRGELYDNAGNMELAVADYRAALAIQPDDDATLKKATMCLLESNRGEDAIALCRQVLKAHPDSQTAKLGAEWVLSRLVPFWHVPMMNETARNQPYYEALKSVVTPDKLVFEIGTGSGLLAMMAATLGARKVVTCEGVKLVADTAKAIVADNQLQDRVTVLAKPSYAVHVGADLPEKADVLVHEIFSSELLGENVLEALEDAKARLVKPGAEILPGTASIMIALVSGEELGKELHVDEAFGFNLRAFNAIHPKKRPLHREDLPRILLSNDIEAFRFDFRNQSAFPPEKKHIDIAVRQDGRCWGVIQWIRFEFVPGIFFE